eukprot:TRINITY_DN68022_c5_g12_i1.p1 TRINITY_DN68022_c5_g12~~TRINITY_DN68022_c5_g12_i1.p1  ORF type:complete len:498 (+),score=6.16 TRINITY_DN68022_c5_g12_i1:13-1506(+)
MDRTKTARSRTDPRNAPSFCCTDECSSSNQMPPEHTPLTWAGWIGDLREMVRLIDDGADVCQTTNGKLTGNWGEGYTLKDLNVFHCAALRGRCECLTWLIKNHCEHINTPNAVDGATPLHLASFGGNLEAVQMLVEQAGCSLQLRDVDGDTPLTTACSQGKISVAEWFLHNGSCITETNTKGTSCLLFAANEGHLDTIKWLLLVAGSSINERDQDGRTALLHSVISGSLECIQWLLSEGGSSISERDNLEQTALLHATLNSDTRVISWLLEEGGSDPAEMDSDGDTALGLAANVGDLVTVKWLMNTAKFNLHAANNTGLTPLLWATQQGYIEVVEYLLTYYSEEEFRQTKSHMLSQLQYCGPQLSYRLIHSGFLDVCETHLQPTFGMPHQPFHCRENWENLPRKWSIVEHYKFPHQFQRFLVLVMWSLTRYHTRRGTNQWPTTTIPRIPPELVACIFRFIPSNGWYPCKYNYHIPPNIQHPLTPDGEGDEGGPSTYK